MRIRGREMCPDPVVKVRVRSFCLKRLKVIEGVTVYKQTKWWVGRI